MDTVTLSINDLASLDLIKKRLNQKGSSIVNIIYEENEKQKYTFKLNTNLKVTSNDIEYFEKHSIKPIF